MTKRAVPIDPFPPYPREASLTTRVTWVRIRRAVGGRMVDLCRETGLRPSEVWRLLRGQAPRPRLSAAEAAERAEYVRRRRASGAAWETIAGETGLSRVTVRKLAQLADEHIALHYAPRLLRVEAYRCPNGHRVRYRPCLVCALGGALGLPEPIVERLIAQRRYIEDPDRQKHRPAPRVNARRYALALARRAPPHPGAAGKPGALVARIRAAAESSGLTPHVVRHIWLVDSIRRRAVRDARAALRGSDHPLAAAALGLVAPAVVAQQYGDDKYQPQSGQEGKDVIWVPTAQVLLDHDPRVVDVDHRARVVDPTKPIPGPVVRWITLDGAEAWYAEFEGQWILKCLKDGFVYELSASSKTGTMYEWYFGPFFNSFKFQQRLAK